MLAEPHDWVLGPTFPHGTTLNPGGTGPRRSVLTLTGREREVLQLAAHDFSAPAIALCLGVSQATVKSHFARIYAKLGVRSRGGATAEGVRLGLIA